jgi:sulfur relay (sulfurtransferase) complex TusBCD TusD component (DsrE family)
MFVLLALSSHLLQMSDVSVAFPIKTALKQEIHERIDHIAHSNPEEREKAQTIRRVLVESCINALRRRAMSGDIEDLPAKVRKLVGEVSSGTLLYVFHDWITRCESVITVDGNYFEETVNW